MGASMLQKSDVPFLTTEDEKGRARFHFLNPGMSLALDYSKPGWIHDYSLAANSTPSAEGLERFSKHSVLFHYVSGEQRAYLYNRLVAHTICPEYMHAAEALPAAKIIP